MMKKALNLSLSLAVLTAIFLSVNAWVLKHNELPVTCTLSGTVSHSESRIPLNHAEIFIVELGRKAVTDSLGHFSIGMIPEGEYTIRISKAGFIRQTIEHFIMHGNSLNRLDVLLKPDPNIKADQEPVLLMDSISEAEELVGYAPPRSMAKSAYGIMGNAGTASWMYDGYSETGFNTEEYDRIYENNFKKALNEPLSTFSIDVDNASYSNMRRFLTMGQMPPADAIRVEELVNYFDYDYLQPEDDVPFRVYTELSDCPWNPQAYLLHIGLQGKDVDYENLQPSNLVFLIDVSGSMEHPQKLPLVKTALSKLVDQLQESDHVAIVVYAGAAGLVLPSTPGNQKKTIKNAINRLSAGGSTAGGAGIKLAYKVALENFIEEGNNRVILVTDGDFNVGASSDAEMVRLIEEKRESGVFLTVCGFGMGNYKDSKMEKLADKGNGNYFYIDNENEADKVFVTDMRATLFTIAKDVKLQVEFNPAIVKEYRLVGYENRVMNNEDFDNDQKDAGELGAGHTVTAMYEIIPTKAALEGMQSDPGKQSSQPDMFGGLKYQEQRIKPEAYESGEIMTLKMRYKQPDGDKSCLLSFPVKFNYRPLDQSTDDFRWAAAVTEFGLLLRDSQYKGNGSYAQVLELAKKAQGPDLNGYRAEFIQLVQSCLQIVVSK